MRTGRAISTFIFALGGALIAGGGAARAGGFDVPDVGTEALGRGGAFVAKADSPLALYYNVAGLAQQRGTRVLLDVNLLWHNMEFTRAGVYSGDPNNPQTPWAGKPYPTMSNQTPFGYQPFLGITSDLGFFERWTFGMGVFSPPGTSARSYGTVRQIAVTNDKGMQKTATRYETDLPGGTTAGWGAPGLPNRAPAPTRFDTGDSSTMMIMPSLAAAFAPSKYISLGASAMWVTGQAESTKATLYPGGKYTCGDAGDDPACDRYSTIRGTFQTYGFNFSVLTHPTSWLDVGLTYRPQININAHGKSTPMPAWTDGAQVQPFPIELSLVLPHILRWGIRVSSHYTDGTERADLELGGTYENWKAQDYSRLRSWDYPLGKTVDPSDPHYDPTRDPGSASYDPNKPAQGRLFVDTPGQFQDTFSIRLGGAYNYRLSDLQRLIFRAGAYFDSATTAAEYTSVGSYGMARYGLTLGFGFKHKGFTLDLAYANVFMPERVVTNSAIRASSSVNGTLYEPTDANVIVGNGLYKGSIQFVSLGFTVNFSEFGPRAALMAH